MPFNVIFQMLEFFRNLEHPFVFPSVPWLLHCSTLDCLFSRPATSCCLGIPLFIAHFLLDPENKRFLWIQGTRDFLDTMI